MTTATLNEFVNEGYLSADVTSQAFDPYYDPYDKRIDTGVYDNDGWNRFEEGGRSYGKSW